MSEGRKEICKNCEYARPTYKGIACELKKKKVKMQGTCEKFWPKG